jgi:hypothetical protein
MEDKNTRIILPTSGIWTVQDLAEYLDIDPSALQQKLSDFGVRVMAFSNRYKHKLLKLEDITAKIGTSKYDVIATAPLEEAAPSGHAP